ncbi:hypothetical protein D3C87_1661820 [compost metagenome]
MFKKVPLFECAMDIRHRRQRVEQLDLIIVEGWVRPGNPPGNVRMAMPLANTQVSGWMADCVGLSVVTEQTLHIK